MLTAARDRAISLGELLAGIRFLTALPRLLRRSITTEEARRPVTDRTASRQADFLYLASRAIYPYPANTYHQLLRGAGCELGDLERMLRLEGLEGALAALHLAGVYVRLTELKGRRPI